MRRTLNSAMISAMGRVEKDKRGPSQRAIVMPKKGEKEGRGPGSAALRRGFRRGSFARSRGANGVGRGARCGFSRAAGDGVPPPGR